MVHFQCDGATSMVFIKGRFWRISSMSHSGYICESQTQIMPWADGQGLRCCSHETVILKNTLLKDSQRWLYLQFGFRSKSELLFSLMHFSICAFFSEKSAIMQSSALYFNQYLFIEGLWATMIVQTKPSRMDACPMVRFPWWDGFSVKQASGLLFIPTKM